MLGKLRASKSGARYAAQSRCWALAWPIAFPRHSCSRSLASRALSGCALRDAGATMARAGFSSASVQIERASAASIYRSKGVCFMSASLPQSTDCEFQRICPPLGRAKCELLHTWWNFSDELIQCGAVLLLTPATGRTAASFPKIG